MGYKRGAGHAHVCLAYVAWAWVPVAEHHGRLRGLDSHSARSVFTACFSLACYTEWPMVSRATVRPGRVSAFTMGNSK